MTLALHLAYRISNARVRAWPFPHIVVQEVFPWDFYRWFQEAARETGKHIRNIHETRPVGSGYSKARQLDALNPTFIEGLPEPLRPVWREVDEAMHNPEVTYAFLRVFAPWVRQRWPHWPAEKPILEAEALPTHDTAGYNLGPHTDSPNKVLSAIFYLPSAWDDAGHDLGTSLYIPRDPTFRCPGGRHYPSEGFERVYTAPYLANTLFAFFKTDNSFHGVEVVPEGASRDVLIFDVRERVPDERVA